MTITTTTRRVLIAEDDPSLRPLLRLLLESDERFEVVGEATDGVEALELLEASDPDLLLLDIAMPRMDGLQVLDHLDGRSRPAVAVLTGFVSDQLAEQVRASGATCFQKGAAFRDLPEQLARQLGTIDAPPLEDAAECRVVTSWFRPQQWRTHLLGGDPYWVEEELLVTVDGVLVHELSWDRPLTDDERRQHDEVFRVWLRPSS